MQVGIGTDPFAVFQDADWALMIGAKPRGPGQERADLLDQNGRIFVDQVSTEEESGWQGSACMRDAGCGRPLHSDRVDCTAWPRHTTDTTGRGR